MSSLKELKSELLKAANPEKAIGTAKYFQAKPGGYGEGDLFHGISVPHQRKIAKKYFQTIDFSDILQLLCSDFHEERLTAIFILVYKFEKSKSDLEIKKIVEAYLEHTDFINNWDLVDSSAHKIIGPYYEDKPRTKLFELAHSKNLWEQRIAVISTFYFIKKDDFSDALKMAKELLHHKHDLMHKAIGWMLREIGNRNLQVLLQFLNEHYLDMPRTMLRYAIEKFEEGLRQDYLKGKIA